MSDNTAATAMSTQHVVLMMDHGQFYLRGGLGDGENEYLLLEQALDAQPNSGDGHTMVVISLVAVAGHCTWSTPVHDPWGESP